MTLVTQSMKLCYQEHDYPFRSSGLFFFLRILKDAYPDWVDMAAIEARLPGISPRQLARFVDLLEEAGLQLVRYETKTRGRFQLAVKPELIVVSGEPEPSTEILPLAPVRFMPIDSTPLAVYQDEAWVNWVVAMIYSTLALHDGRLSGEDGALTHLDVAEAATRTLPLWVVSIVYVCRAFVLKRKSRYREATFWLRRADTAIRQGHAHPAAKARVQLVRAKMRYDQARYTEAECLLGLPTGSDISHHPNWLNINALVTGRKFLAAKKPDAPALLAQTLSALTEALGHVFLWNSDTNLLDGLCYNFANNLLRGIKSGLIHESSADTVMQWLAANMLVCRKLGIGDDSVLASLLLVDVGLDYGYSVKQWPHLLSCELNVSGSIEGVLTNALTQARKMGNRLEIAQCLQRQVRLSASPEGAKPAYVEAVELFGELGRKDLVNELAVEWRNRFGRSPSRLKKSRGEVNERAE